MTEQEDGREDDLEDERADVGDAGTGLGDAGGDRCLADRDEDEGRGGDRADDLGDDVADGIGRRACACRGPSRSSRPG